MKPCTSRIKHLLEEKAGKTPFEKIQRKKPILTPLEKKMEENSSLQRLDLVCFHALKQSKLLLH